MLKLIPADEIVAAEEVVLNDPIKAFKICQQLERICIEERGLGISAVQAGIPWQLFLMYYHLDENEGVYRYFFNCKYEPIGDKKIAQTLEGCLSLPGILYEIRDCRWEKVHISGYELVVNDQNELIFEAVDFEMDNDSNYANSVVFQHEIDHQKGQSGLVSNMPSAKGVKLFKRFI